METEEVVPVENILDVVEVRGSEVVIHTFGDGPKAAHPPAAIRVPTSSAPSMVMYMKSGDNLHQLHDKKPDFQEKFLEAVLKDQGVAEAGSEVVQVVSEVTVEADNQGGQFPAMMETVEEVEICTEEVVGQIELVQQQPTVSDTTVTEVQTAEDHKQAALEVEVHTEEVVISEEVKTVTETVTSATERSSTAEREADNQLQVETPAVETDQSSEQTQDNKPSKVILLGQTKGTGIIEFQAPKSLDAAGQQDSPAVAGSVDGIVATVQGEGGEKALGKTEAGGDDSEIKSQVEEQIPVDAIVTNAETVPPDPPDAEQRTGDGDAQVSTVTHQVAGVEMKAEDGKPAEEAKQHPPSDVSGSKGDAIAAAAETKIGADSPGNEAGISMDRAVEGAGGGGGGDGTNSHADHFLAYEGSVARQAPPQTVTVTRMSQMRELESNDECAAEQVVEGRCRDDTRQRDSSCDRPMSEEKEGRHAIDPEENKPKIVSAVMSDDDDNESVVNVLKDKVSERHASGGAGCAANDEMPFVDPAKANTPLADQGNADDVPLVDPAKADTPLADHQGNADMPLGNLENSDTQSATRDIAVPSRRKTVEITPDGVELKMDSPMKLLSQRRRALGEDPGSWSEDFTSSEESETPIFYMDADSDVPSLSLSPRCRDEVKTAEGLLLLASMSPGRAPPFEVNYYNPGGGVTVDKGRVSGDDAVERKGAQSDNETMLKVNEGEADLGMPENQFVKQDFQCTSSSGAENQTSGSKDLPADMECEASGTKDSSDVCKVERSDSKSEAFGSKELMDKPDLKDQASTTKEEHFSDSKYVPTFSKKEMSDTKDLPPDCKDLKKYDVKNSSLGSTKIESADVKYPPTKSENQLIDSKPDSKGLSAASKDLKFDLNGLSTDSKEWADELKGFASYSKEMTSESKDSLADCKEETPDSKNSSTGNSKEEESDDSKKPSCSKDSGEQSCSKDSEEPSCSENSEEPLCSKDLEEPSCSKDSEQPSCSKDAEEPCYSKVSKEPSSSKDSKEPPCSKDSEEPSCSKDEEEPTCSKDLEEISCSIDAKDSEETSCLKDSEEPSRSKDTSSESEDQPSAPKSDAPRTSENENEEERPAAALEQLEDEPQEELSPHSQPEESASSSSKEDVSEVSPHPKEAAEVKESASSSSKEVSHPPLVEESPPKQSAQPKEDDASEESGTSQHLKESKETDTPEELTKAEVAESSGEESPLAKSLLQLKESAQPEGSTTSDEGMELEETPQQLKVQDGTCEEDEAHSSADECEGLQDDSEKEEGEANEEISSSKVDKEKEMQTGSLDQRETRDGLAKTDSTEKEMIHDEDKDEDKGGDEDINKSGLAQSKNEGNNEEKVSIRQESSNDEREASNKEGDSIDKAPTSQGPSTDKETEASQDKDTEGNQERSTDDTVIGNKDGDSVEEAPVSQGPSTDKETGNTGGSQEQSTDDTVTGNKEGDSVAEASFSHELSTDTVIVNKEVNSVVKAPTGQELSTDKETEGNQEQSTHTATDNNEDGSVEKAPSSQEPSAGTVNGSKEGDGVEKASASQGPSTDKETEASQDKDTDKDTECSQEQSTKTVIDSVKKASASQEQSTDAVTDNKDSESVEKAPASQESTYCQLCDRCFGSNEQLERHNEIGRHFCRNADGVYVCRYCQKDFNSIGGVIYHESVCGKTHAAKQKKPEKTGKPKKSAQNLLQKDDETSTTAIPVAAPEQTEIQGDKRRRSGRRAKSRTPWESGTDGEETMLNASPEPSKKPTMGSKEKASNRNAATPKQTDLGDDGERRKETAAVRTPESSKQRKDGKSKMEKSVAKGRRTRSSAVADDSDGEGNAGTTSDEHLESSAAYPGKEKTNKNAKSRTRSSVSNSDVEGNAGTTSDEHLESSVAYSGKEKTNAKSRAPESDIGEQGSAEKTSEKRSSVGRRKKSLDGVPDNPSTDEASDARIAKVDLPFTRGSRNKNTDKSETAAPSVLLSSPTVSGGRSKNMADSESLKVSGKKSKKADTQKPHKETVSSPSVEKQSATVSGGKSKKKDDIVSPKVSGKKSKKAESQKPQMETLSEDTESPKVSGKKSKKADTQKPQKQDTTQLSWIKPAYSSKVCKYCLVRPGKVKGHKKNCIRFNMWPPFLCPPCKLRFQTRLLLNRHMERGVHQNADGKYVCRFCPKDWPSDFNKLGNLYTHVRKYHRDRIVISDDNAPTSASSVSDDVRIETDSNKLTKDSGNKLTKDSGGRRPRVESHPEDAPTSATSGTAKGVLPTTINSAADDKLAHLQKTLAPPNFCRTCHRSFSHARLYEKHMTVGLHKNSINGCYTCGVCAAEFKVVGLLQKHLEEEHREAAKGRGFSARALKALKNAGELFQKVRKYTLSLLKNNCDVVKYRRLSLYNNAPSYSVQTC